MAATVRIVDGVGGATLMDLNRHLSGAMLGPRGDVQLADTALAQSTGSDQGFVWSTAANASAPVELATRQITVPVVLFAATADAAAALVAQLTQLVKARFVLEIQRHGGSVPVWLRCGPCAPKLITQVAAAGQPTTIVTGTLTAATDPYAVGARVDVGAATITQDPATGTPFVVDVTVTAGDSLTPVVLRTTDTDITGQVDRIFLSVRRRGDPTSLSGLVVQAEDGTTSTGTTPPTLSTITGDSALSGGSGIRATYGAGASGTWSVACDFSALTGVEAPGLYRLLVRVRRAGGAAGAYFTLVATAGTARLVEPFTASGSDTRIIDLGLVQVPIGQPPYLAAPESPLSATGGTVTVTVYRPEDGTGTVDLDWVGLFPADADAGVLEVGQAQSGTLVLDGYDHVPRMFSDDPFTGTSPSATGGPGLSYIGGVPRLRVGANRLYVVAGLGASVARAPTLSLDVAVSYWPRWGWLG